MYHVNNYPAGNYDFSPKASLEGRRIGEDFADIDGWNMYHGSHIPGFPHHPHKGFETISIIEEGYLDHSDSLGNGGRFGAGDVQWMTAGSGVQHSEMGALMNMDRRNRKESFQIWLNLPASSKNVDPDYKMLWREDIPIETKRYDDDRTVTVKVIAGEYDGIVAIDPTPNSWAADPKNKVRILLIHMDKDTSWTLPKTDEGTSRRIYLYRGKNVTVDNNDIISNSQYAQLVPDAHIEFKNRRYESKYATT
ncbi:pirin family protein [Halosquirtibacter xylanolyticus]|nr:pirin family protein [Prolixibacteraceae bacterium]